MTIAEQLKVLEAALAPWAQTRGGDVQIAGDALDAFNLLAVKPGKPRVVLQFDSETVRGEYDELGRVDRKYLAIVTVGKGMNIKPGAALTDGTAGGAPVLDLIEEAREVLRGLRLDEEEAAPVYSSISPYSPGGVPVDAYQVAITIGTQIPRQ